MKPTRVVIAALSSLLLIQAAIVFRSQERDREQVARAPNIWHATWEFHPQTPLEAKQFAAAVVLARVTAVEQAADIVTPLPGTTHVDRDRSQRISLEVTRTLVGNPVSTIRLYHIGDDNTWIHDDPPYHMGESYVLFIRNKIDEAGTHLVISPEGRYRLVNDRLEPVAEGDNWATALRGKTLAELEQALSLR